MEDGIMRLLQSQERIQKVIREEVQGWMDDLFRDAFNPESFLRLVAGMGMDPSRIPNLAGKQEGFDCYRVLGLEKTVTDEEVKKRYRERLRQFHPDTAGPGMEFHLQAVMAAYELIKRERGWQ